jgi:hypothetical protein
MRTGWIREEFMEVYAHPSFRQGLTAEGEPYSLTDSEYEFIGRLIDAYSGPAEEAVAEIIIEQLTFTPPDPIMAALGGGNSMGVLSLFGGSSKQVDLREDVGQGDWWPKLVQFSLEVATASNEKMIQGTVNGKPISLAKPQYSASLRKNALNVVKPEGYWLPKPTENPLEAAIRKELEKFQPLWDVAAQTEYPKAPTSLSEVKTRLQKLVLSPSVQKWVNVELQILSDMEAKRF